jgi:hypothetical protein
MMKTGGDAFGKLLPKNRHAPVKNLARINSGQKKPAHICLILADARRLASEG